MFGRKRKFDRTIRERGVPPEHESERAAADISTSGPFDVSDAPEEEGDVLDFGAMRIPANPGFEVRLEMTGQGVLQGVTLQRADSVMQLGVFAAPRSGGAWEQIREDILGEAEKSGAKLTQQDGRFGPELRGLLAAPGGGTQAARFLGVDGPRWFLRGLIAGPAAADDDRSAEFEDVFAGIVVDRGSDPKPVREPITLRLPDALQQQVDAAAAQAREQAARAAAGGNQQ
ncbi:DUF3710 domain-containing protein [Epidermidibacterium keratini]|uniref:DUF3710 domain-containing protein n=1 Tax=Epidermidibacterium keratini TaxID=1891644 RepID=A0A7L4YRT9_9ACTN|nr:DUF3710 domain-containing protein [Epidermidibacterium keratini]QHC01961.1 DUF3710 domain-containing protein [Epidermidibacterium keratini]